MAVQGRDIRKEILERMAVKVIYIAGVPASGKSSLMKLVRDNLLADSKEFKHGLCRGIESRDGKYKMLGVFDGSLFEGTDKLGMTVINDALQYIGVLQAAGSKTVVFVEGDRLFNIRFLSKTHALLLVIDANEAVLKWRHIERGDTQTETFLKSRRSKVENFIARYKVRRIWNNTPKDQERILSYILKTAREYVD